METVTATTITAEPITVQVHRLAHAPQHLPHYATSGAAGMDVRAAIETPLTLKPFERFLAPTGFVIRLPEGYECQIRPRSGLSIKHGVTLINCVGTVDSDYRDEVKVPLVNLSQDAYELNPGERIAQLIFAPVTRAAWEEISLDAINDDRHQLERQGGFGSTGHH